MQNSDEKKIENIYPADIKNLYDALRKSSEKFPDKIAVIEEKRKITYSRLREKTDVLADYLMGKFRIKQGDRVGLLFVNSIDFYIAFYAVMKLGAIAVLVNTKMQSEEIAFTLGDTGTHCLITNERWLEKISGIITDLKIDRIITEVSTDKRIPDVQMTSMENIFDTADGLAAEHAEAVQKDDLTAVIMHTSGTTGKPKGIMVSHQNIMGTAYGYRDVLGLNENDITVISVPVFHILALSCVSNTFLNMGGTMVVFERFDANKALEAMEKYRATHFHSVPAVYIKMMQEATRKYDLSSWRIAVCGGAIISEEYKEKFYRMVPSASFRIAYGLTETAGSGVLSFEHGMPGKEVPNCRLSILDEKTGLLMDYGEGEAICEGPVVTTKIWGRTPEDPLRLHTGDIVRKEKNGDIYILDRIKDVINRGGEKLFPSSIETALLRYEGVDEAIVFPVSDELLGEVPAAILVEKENCRISLEEIQKDLPKRIGKFELPQYLEIWKKEDIPLTGNGKVRKKRLREIFEEILNKKSGS
ncbi:class I adenylate-forming enzyme family protein [Ruminococcus sp. 5_1_39BFAA]|uniref:class I adenylate-forming enzyme family protein n=1 Tax=Ruminococcus sp. 5_1_39BFAA TaxID=457412 RepID=UPI003562E5C5